MTPTKRLGELLVNKGLLTAVQLDEVLQTQRSTGELMGAILVRKGWISEEQLLGTLSEQFGMPRVHLDSQQVDWEVAKRFPTSLLGEDRCFPLQQKENAVMVAISDPLDAWTMSGLEKEARGLQVKFILASRGEIAFLIRRHRQRTLAGTEGKPG